MEKVMSHDRLRIGEAGRKRVVDNFMWDNLAKEILGVIDKYRKG